MARRFNQTLRSYADLAPAYAADHTDRSAISRHARRFCELVRTGGRVADLGCGPGHDCRGFSDHGLSTIGVDLTIEMLCEARTRLPNLKAVVADLNEELPFAGAFAGVWACASLVHVPRSRFGGVLSRIGQSMEHEGILFVSLLEGEGEAVREEEKPYGRLVRRFVYYSASELRQGLEAAQFRILATKTEAPWRTAYATRR